MLYGQIMKSIHLLLGTLLLVAFLAGTAQAEPIITLQRAVTAAEKVATDQEGMRQKAHDETLAAVQRLAKGDTAAARIALAAAETREQAAAIGTLQSSAALRRARQALSEAVTAAIEQGDAVERAAQRAAHGEVAPGVRDLLACDKADCVKVPLREHAAMVLMGAVPLDFDAKNWPPDETAPAVTVLSSHPSAPRIATLRAAASEAAETASKTQARAEAAYRAMATGRTSEALSAFGAAQGEADSARAAQAAADENLRLAERTFADAGRALKRAALLAGDGYALARGGKKACAGKACVSAEGMEAAAFLVLGAAEDLNDGLKSLAAYVVRNENGEFVFR